MGQRVNLDTKSVTEPLLQKGFTGRDGVAKDAQRSAAIDLLEPIQDGAAERLVDLGIAHVVDAKGHNGLDAFFTNPLRRGQPRKGKPNMEWVFPVKVSQTIGRGIRLRLAKRSQQKKGGRDRQAEAAHYAVAKRHESGVTMPLDKCRDKFLPWDFGVSEKSSKVSIGLPIVIPSSAVEMSQEHGKRLKGFPAAWMRFYAVKIV
tara:strand:- start:175 stop:783 length:609 start_codon:yes stop_codon:yes gene_type:complete